ncbi:exodeoxyribonuclease V subunit alpha [Geobacter benzoatilyticus]|uniref:Exodeoxyribonuclease V subunit alpha n=1 Tax=Geobacter benzoatilyticus TaxID=2815309 RepID=A0ABX7Q8C0_9BACT|nr:exodeoxyribonuclease V subunit alpha [Geobacter benzoatilyticus]QSV47447.1 exodeoxyribonuclease V subunit alpha [Geobacter benzoatilyticus]
MASETSDYRDIDFRFADFLCRLARSGSDELRRAALRVSNAVGQGHICVDLAAEAGGEEESGRVTDLLRSSGVVGNPGEFAPLVLDDTRLYLYRYWKYETELAEKIIEKAGSLYPVDGLILRDGIARLFGSPADGETDWQRVAAAAALHSGFTVISGGPGTGKTSTVVKIIALLLEQSGSDGFRVALTAPTGKAAARLKDAIRGAREGLAGLTPVQDRIPDEVTTIHRLLGVIPGSNRFRYHRGNLLPHDVVVVDEASMVALPLMARLVEAMAPKARLVLLGDRDQLASVEAGAVLGDIYDTGDTPLYSPEFRRFVEETTGERLERDSADEPPSPLADSLVILRKNYRFGAGSGIGALSRAINGGDGVGALALLRDGGASGVTWRETPSVEALEQALSPEVLDGYGDYLAKDDPAAVLTAFDRFRVLCAVREGRYGVAGLNGAIERILAARGIISPNRRWYRGRPVMVTVNDYALRLFNGDVGITLPDPENPGNLAVFFPSATEGVRKVSPLRLPHHETVFAMTVHKSQGSEFDKILMVIPPVESPVLTRELLYTGITRARAAAGLWCGEAVFNTAVARRVERRSGLRKALAK